MQYVEGWALRSSPSLPFRRSNCAIGLRGAGSPPWRDLDAFYAERGLPVRAQTATANSTDVNDEFGGRGFEIEAPVDVLIAATTNVLAENTPADDVMTIVNSVLDDAFAEIYGRLHDDD